MVVLLLRGIIRYTKGQLPVSPSAKDDVIVSRMYQMSMVYRREKIKRVNYPTETLTSGNRCEDVISRAIYLNRENIKSLLRAGKSSGCLTINYPAGQEIDTFIESYSDRLNDEFKSRYGYDFFCLSCGKRLSTNS